MTVVLRGEKLILRRELSVDGPGVDDAAVGRRIGDHAFGKIEEREHRFALRERGEHPLREADDTEACERKAGPNNVSARDLLCHAAEDITRPASASEALDRWRA